MNVARVRKTIDAYNKNADKYREKFDNYQAYKKRIIEFQRKFINNGSNILDLACGPGNNINTILQQDRTCRFTGVDLSYRLLDIAKNRFPNFQFAQQDLRHISLKNEYDVIIASFCIVHLKTDETEKLLKKISELFRGEGYLYLSYMNGKGCGFETTSFSRDKIYFNYYDDRYIADLLGKNKLKILEVNRQEYLETNGSSTTDVFIYAKKET